MGICKIPGGVAARPVKLGDFLPPDPVRTAGRLPAWRPVFYEAPKKASKDCVLVLFEEVERPLRQASIRAQAPWAASVPRALWALEEAAVGAALWAAVSMVVTVEASVAVHVTQG